ncbi:uncharacterized protein LOC144026620 [Festucalex cinctus]
MTKKAPTHRAQSDPSHSEQNKECPSTNTSKKKDPKDSGWLEVDEVGWQPTIFPFAAKPGPRDAAAELNSHLPADILELFITDELLQHIIHHTNLYANQSMQKQTDKNCDANPAASP